MTISTDKICGVTPIPVFKEAKNGLVIPKNSAEPFHHLSCIYISSSCKYDKTVLFFSINISEELKFLLNKQSESKIK